MHAQMFQCTPWPNIARLASREYQSSGQAVANAIGYAEHRSRSHHAVIRVYNEAGDVTETHEHTSEFKGDFVTRLGKRHARA